MQDLLRVLSQWPATQRGATVERVTSAPGLSGAGVWRVVAADQPFALRCWPFHMRAEQLALIHTVQAVLGAHGPPVVPLLQTTTSGRNAAFVDARFWELATWRPGSADFHARPTTPKLVAGLQMLAEIHNTASRRISTPWPFQLEADRGRTIANSARRRSNAAALRAERLSSLASNSGRSALRSALAKSRVEKNLDVGEIIDHIERLAAAKLAEALRWREQDLPLQYRLGDVHHDHVLFVGDEVTGVIDFGAVDFDSPAGDVGRLLGSLVGNDPERWLVGLNAYDAVRPLLPVERDAASFYYSTGTLIAAANWVGWLWPETGEQGHPCNHDAGIARLRQLLVLLRGLT